MKPKRKHTVRAVPILLQLPFRVHRALKVAAAQERVPMRSYTVQILSEITKATKATVKKAKRAA